MDMDRGMYYALEHVAARLWDLTEQPTTVEAICQQLLAEYDIAPDECDSQVRAFVQELVARDLVRQV